MIDFLYVRGQLAFDFTEVEEVGNLDEAMELWEYQDARTKGRTNGTPPGWEYLGSGGTRVAYKSPGGVCYKVCYEYDDDDESHNEIEHKNMSRIRREGKLPKDWAVPKTHLHVFPGRFHEWDYHMKRKKEKSKRVVILACDYIKGYEIGWSASESERRKLVDAFSACGLSDTGGANAIRSEDGTYYVIDAAELMPPEES